MSERTISLLEHRKRRTKNKNQVSAALAAIDEARRVLNPHHKLAAVQTVVNRLLWAEEQLERLIEEKRGP